MSPYPVDPQDHVDDKSKDALDPSTYHPIVLNEVAYARYAINGLRLPAAPLSNDPDVLRAELANLASATGISASAILGYYAITASPAQIDAVRQGILSEAHGLDPATYALSTLGKRSVDTMAQVEACAADLMVSNGAERCCRALAYPTALIGEWSKLSATDKAALTTAASTDPAFLLSYATTQPPPSFRLQGLKAWVVACAATTIEHAPPTLADFKALHGDFHDPTWQDELHPTSRAKLAGRRIYRKGEISVAESLDDDCSVRETEIVLPRADGERSFLTYSAAGDLVPYGYFPSAKLDVDFIKYSPDSCMGCHYTFDTRQFKIRFPSFKALNLTLPTAADGTPLWKDASACQRPGETMIFHVD